MKTLRTLLIAFSLFSFTCYADSSSPLYYREQIQLDEAQKLTSGNDSIKVAILSTGVNYELPQLVEKLDFLKGGTGIYPNDFFGADVVKRTGQPRDSIGVGTSVATLISSSEYGVAPGVKIIPIKVTHESGRAHLGGIARGFAYAIARGAQIVFLDVEGGEIGPYFEECGPIELAERHGILVVGVAGNFGKEVTSQKYPVGCSSPGLLTVTSTDRSKKLARFASWGSAWVDLAAPGERISTLSRDGKPTTLSGGSASGALVAGAAALVWSMHPEYTPAQVKQALMESASREESLEGKTRSEGILNAFGALKASVSKGMP